MRSSAGTSRTCGGALRWHRYTSRPRRITQHIQQSHATFLLCIFFTLIHSILVVHFCNAQSSRWVTAYYAGWQLGNGENGYLPVSKVDFSALTHVIHFALVPRPDGSLDSTSNSITRMGALALLKMAHAYDAKVLICIGGAGSEPAFQAATDTAIVQTFVSNIVAFVTNVGYDGVDIDWEPIDQGDNVRFTRLASMLRESLNAASRFHVLTTTCVGGNQAIMARDQEFFDQINIMTYDMSFPSQGWVVWFNSPIYDGGIKFPGLDEYVPSIDADVKDFESAGVVAGKIGIGAEFGGTVWKGVTLPGQLLSGLLSVQYDVPLYASDGSGIMQRYYDAGSYSWDSAAQAGYLSISGLLGIFGEFVSYDDSNSIKAKAHYIDSAGIGGIILYELGMGYPGDGTFPLLNSVKSSFASILRNRPPDIALAAKLEHNYPNPFNPSTTITFSTYVFGQVEVSVYNLLGEKIATLEQGPMSPGTYSTRWDGAGFPSGVYVCRMKFGNTVVSTKMLLIK